MKKALIALLIVLGGFLACQSEDPVEQPRYEEATEETDDSSSDTTDDTAGDTTDDPTDDTTDDTTDDPPPPDYSVILLKSYDYTGGFVEYFTWDDQHRIKRRTFFDSNHTYAYNSSGQFYYETNSWIKTGTIITFYFDSEVMSGALIKSTYLDGGYRQLTYEGLNLETGTLFLEQVDKFGTVTLSEEYEISFTKDEALRVTYFKRVNVDTLEEFEIFLTYKNDNLIRLEFSPGDLYEIEYDTYKAPITGIGLRNSNSRFGVFGMSVGGTFNELLNEIPLFNTFRNKNNMLRLTINGELIREYEYEYNYYEYPETISFLAGGEIRTNYYEYLYRD